MWLLTPATPAWTIKPDFKPSPTVSGPFSSTSGTSVFLFCLCFKPQKPPSFLFTILRPFLSAICESRPDLDFYLAPTTIRARPFWYSDAQASISKVIQEQIVKTQPRLMPLPGFQTDYGSLDSDGIHFNPLAGQNYCMHLIDSARYLFHIYPFYLTNY